MSEFSLQDHHFMQQALQLARLGHYSTTPNPRVGCVIVQQHQVVGRGYHVKAGSAHAEVNALAEAGEMARGATAYVTLEPCSHHGRTPPCASALIKAGISRVVAAMVDPNPAVSGRGLAMLSQAGIETQSGLLQADAEALNVGFIKRMRTGMPYVRCKLAASLDGKTAMASGESQWLTSIEARQDVQRLRAESCAIICGADSVILDNARMTVRWPQLGPLQQRIAPEQLRQPLRVVVDSQHRLTPDLALFSEQSPILLVRTRLENHHNWPHFVEQMAIAPDSTGAKVSLPALLKMLAERGCNEVLLEAGATLAGAFVAQDLVDELVLYQAPMLLGADGKSLLNLPGLTQLAQAKKLALSDITRVGADIRINAHFSR